GDLCLARDERLHDAEAEAAATTGDDDALTFECLHVRSFAAMTIDAGKRMRSAQVSAGAAGFATSTSSTGLSESPFQDSRPFPEQAFPDHAQPELLRGFIEGTGPVGSQELACDPGFASRLPEQPARLGVPKLEPQPKGGDPTPDDLQAGDLEAVGQDLVEPRQSRQQHVANSKRRAEGLQTLALEHATPGEARKQVGVFCGQPLLVEGVQRVGNWL